MLLAVVYDNSLCCRPPYANEDAEIPTGPSRMLVPFAIGAALIALQLNQTFKC